MFHECPVVPLFTRKNFHECMAVTNTATLTSAISQGKFSRISSIREIRENFPPRK